MPKSLADGHIKLTMLAEPLDDPDAATLTEALAGTDVSCNIVAGDYVLSATDSETVTEKELCVEGNIQALGPSVYTGGISPFRYFDDSTKQPDPSEDFVFDATKEKGTVLYLLERESAKKSTEEWEVGDEYSYFVVTTDNPQRIDLTGYIKRRVPLLVASATLNKELTGASV